MKYKTLFRVLLKLLGVYFAVYGAAGTVHFLVQIVRIILDWQQNRLLPQPPVWQFILDATLGGGLYLAIGLYLFLDGRWVVDRAIPGNRPYCTECGYDLSNLTGHICPECGTAFRAADTPTAPPA